VIDLERDTIVIPVNQIPQMRIGSAVERKIHRKLLFTTFGGIGDHICAEPTIRYAAKCSSEYEELALATSIPELYSHIPVTTVYTEAYDRSHWVVLKTYPDEKGLSQEFLSHGIMNCVDFSSIHAIRMQLPTPDREIMLTGKHPGKKYADLCEMNTVFVHPGKHWPSKTFPKWWWDKVIKTIIKAGAVPVLIGANVDGNRATVDADSEGCVDLRNKTMLSELVWMLQRAKVLLTNDSAPLHIAASADPAEYETTGNAWIGLIATCKHHDYITHFRKGVWQWREVAFNKGGIWETTGFLPNKDKDVHINLAEEETIVSWLPDAEEYGLWSAVKALTWKNQPTK
jgi:hypothetical protein